jgi:hypothetical protein
MRDFWFDLASSISAEAFNMPRLAFKPTLPERSTPPATHASTHAAQDAGRGAGVASPPLNGGSRYRNISMSNIQEFQTPATSETITPRATQ